MLIFLGPVQDFIATARKAQDLWFGSWVLSELSRAAALAAREVGALIVPHQDDPGALEKETTNVVNKILVRVDEGDVARCAAAVKQTVSARLDAIAKAAFAGIPKGAFDEGVARSQVHDLPELYWVWTPLTGDFNQARKRAEALLAARKNTRSFERVTWGGSDRKCSLDGAREQVLTSQASAHLRSRLRIGESEKLCGVGLLKRLGHASVTSEKADGHRVLSTSHVASWSTRRAWRSAPEQVIGEYRISFGEYLRRLRALGADSSLTPTDDPVMGHQDGHLLFASRLEDLLPDEQAAESGRAALADLFRAWRSQADAAGIPAPTRPGPYYAILVADGDSMGHFLDGTDERGHEGASAALERFAGRAREIVRAHHGHAVFAGGDDVLALLPVEEAIACADGLRSAFAGEFRSLVREGQSPPTLSVGIGVSHHVTPLADALANARQAERAAKLVPGKNAWAIRLDKRSGAVHLASGPWDRDRPFDDVRGLRDLIDAYLQGDLPRGLPYELADVARRLPGKDLAAIRRLEARRVVRKKREEGKDNRGIDAVDGWLQEGAEPERLACWMLAARALTGLEKEDDR
jgi:CRISPR-associated protein Cmr2